MLKYLIRNMKDYLQMYSGGQKGYNDFVSDFTNKVVSSFLATTVGNIPIMVVLLAVTCKPFIDLLASQFEHYLQVSYTIIIYTLG